MSADETLAAWNRQLEAARGGMPAGGGKPGVSSHEHLAGKTGLQVMQSLLCGELPFNTGPLRAIGKVAHSGRQMATSEAQIVGPDGKLYADATTTCLVFEMRPR